MDTPVFCKDCKYYNVGRDQTLATGSCLSPANIKLIRSHNLVTGESLKEPSYELKYTDINTCRGSYGDCGLEGKNYVQKDLPHLAVAAIGGKFQDDPF